MKGGEGMSKQKEFTAWLVDIALRNSKNEDDINEQLGHIEQALEFPDESYHEFSSWNLTETVYQRALKKAYDELSILTQ